MSGSGRQSMVSRGRRLEDSQLAGVGGKGIKRTRRSLGTSCEAQGFTGAGDRGTLVGGREEDDRGVANFGRPGPKTPVGVLREAFRCSQTRWWGLEWSLAMRMVAGGDRGSGRSCYGLRGGVDCSGRCGRRTGLGHQIHGSGVAGVHIRSERRPARQPARVVLLGVRRAPPEPPGREEEVDGGGCSVS